MKRIFVSFAALLAVFCVALINGCTKDSGGNDSNNVTDLTAPIVFKQGLTYGTMTDQEGNTYKTITIGTQTWMAENLRTTKYRNMSDITHVADDEIWSYVSYEAYCDYEEDSSYPPIYGRLYNWLAVTSPNNIAPTGWHVPADEEWRILIQYLDAGSVFNEDWGVVSNIAGGKLKEEGKIHWFSPNTGATNVSGFTALPGGVRSSFSGFDLAGKSGAWWSASSGLYGSVYYELSNNNSAVYRGQYLFTNGFSVRLVKD